MVSIHQARSRSKAQIAGGYAGHPRAVHLWDLSKRELIEIALRLAEMRLQQFDYNEDGLAPVIARVDEERRTLKVNKVI